MPEAKAKAARKPAARKAAARKPAASATAAAKTATQKATATRAAPKKKGLIRAVRTRRKARAGKAKTVSSFGGYRKRTITAREFAGSLYSLAPQASMIYQIWGKQELDPGFREELMLAVAKLNDCRYCTWGHHEWAYISGVPEDELAHIENMDPEGFDRGKWVAISYVRALVSANYGQVDSDLLRELKQHYSAHEIKEIELVARVMDISNRGANTWDAMLSRVKGNPANDSHLLDEIVMSGVFWSAAPIVILLLARESKRPFKEVAKSMLDYVKHYDEGEQDSAA
jgi:AhpD family alkylhydroperoxidase